MEEAVDTKRMRLVNKDTENQVLDFHLYALQLIKSFKDSMQIAYLEFSCSKTYFYDIWLG